MSILSNTKKTRYLNRVRLDRVRALYFTHRLNAI